MAMCFILQYKNCNLREICHQLGIENIFSNAISFLPCHASSASASVAKVSGVFTVVRKPPWKEQGTNDPNCKKCQDLSKEEVVNEWSHIQ